MSFDFNPIYLIYVLVAASAALFAEGFYLLAASGASYRKNVNRRLKLLQDEPNRENILIQLRRERGLTMGGDFMLPSVALNRLIVQSGLSIGLSRIAILAAFAASMSPFSRARADSAMSMYESRSSRCCPCMFSLTICRARSASRG